MTDLPESKESLWMLAASPLIWAAHFLLCYLTAAVWCAKVGGSLEDVRIAIGIYTLIALGGIGVMTRIGFRRHSFGTGGASHDFDSPGDRHRFLGFASFLLSMLSAIAVIYVALTAIFLGSCI